MSATFYVKTDILGFADHIALSHLLNSAVLLWKQPQTICNWTNLIVHRWNLRPLTPALSSPSFSSTSWLYFLNYSFRLTCNLTCNHIKSHLLIPHCSPSYSLPLLKCLPVIILSLLFLYLHSHSAFEIQYHLEYLTQSLNTIPTVISFHDLIFILPLHPILLTSYFVNWKYAQPKIWELCFIWWTKLTT